MLYTLMTILVLLDVISEWRTECNIMTPFLLGTQFELLYETPRILYQIGNLRLRAGCHIWYGVLVGLAARPDSSKPAASVGALAAVVLSALASLVGVVFVLPFFSKAYRPFPIACGFCLLFMLFQTNFFDPLTRSLNFLQTKPPLLAS